MKNTTSSHSGNQSTTDPDRIHARIVTAPRTDGKPGWHVGAVAWREGVVSVVVDGVRVVVRDSLPLDASK